MYGNSVDYDSILKITKKYKLYLIEDCAESIGTKYDNKLVGTFGDVACFSFYGNKTITTGEGGMVSTNDLNLFKKIQLLRGQGFQPKKDEYYNHVILGYNYRLNNISAHIGYEQLKIIDEIIEKKIKIANRYIETLVSIKNIKLQPFNKKVFHTHWLFSFLCNSNIERNKLINFLKLNSIETRPFFKPINELKFYAGTSNTPISRNLARRGISLPSYPNLTTRDIDNILNAVKDFYNV